MRSDKMILFSWGLIIISRSITFAGEKGNEAVRMGKL